MAKLLGGLFLLVLALLALKMAVGMVAFAAKVTVVGLLAVGAISVAGLALKRRN